jgi:hypothetical protein
MNIGAWVKEHKAATAAIVIGGVGVLYLLTRGGGGSSGGSADAASQIAELNANAQQVDAQVQAQQNEAQIQANAANEQVQASVQANQDTIAGQVAETAIAAQAQDYGEGVQGQVFNELISTGEQEQIAQDQLTGTALNDQYGAINNITSNLPKEAGKGQIISAGTNIIAELENQGNVGSYNQANASEQIASTVETGSILSGLLKGGTSIVSGLFGGL